MRGIRSAGRPALSFALLVLLLCVGGCGRKQYPVSGKVTYEDGTPVTGGVVVFESLAQEGTIPVMARGAIQADGSYQLSTSKPGDGAPPGQYRVRLIPPEPELDSPKRSPQPFDKRYKDFKTSGLEFEVTNGSNVFPITVTKPGPR